MNQYFFFCLGVTNRKLIYFDKKQLYGLKWDFMNLYSNLSRTALPI